MSRRVQRLSRDIAKHAAVIINRQEWPAERVTVASAEISNKFDYARIYVSIWPKNSEEETLKEINLRKGLIKKELAVKLNMRLMPEIGFYLDRGLEASSRIAELLREVEKEID